MNSTSQGVVYCPVCERNLFAENADEVSLGLHDGYIFIHGDIGHEDSDLEALSNGMQ